MDRILLLMTAHCYQDAHEALENARAQAAAPERLTYGLSLAEEPEAEENAAMHALGTAQYLCPGRDAWDEAEALWQGEGYILMAHPAMRFTRHWDMQLLRALRQCRRESVMTSVLTGYLPRPADPVDAVYPVAAEAFDEEGRLCFQRGTALRYAKAPQRSAFLHPDFCFAPSGFFREMAAASASPRFLRAFRNKWEVFTLHRPLIHMLWDIPLPAVLVDPALETEEGGLSRFEKRFGLRFASRQLSAMARQGVFTADLTFPMRVPLPVRVQEALRELTHSSRKVTPLCVTAFLNLPQPQESLREEYVSWFRRLARLKNLALLCYADGPMVRQLTAIHPNVLEYKRRYGLPVEENMPQEQALNYVRLCKPFLLAQSREKQLGHTHYVWVDFGYLRYPVYERASLDWEALCTDKITLATVGGVPDLSVVVMPQEQVLPLCREIDALCRRAWKAEGRFPEEAELWQGLIREHPDLFRTVDMPAPRELLTLALTSREAEVHSLA